MKSVLLIISILLVACTMNTDKKKKSTKYEWYASGNAPTLYPTLIHKGDFVFPDKSKLFIPISYPFATTWGQSVSMYVLNNNEFPAPNSIAISWWSLIENQFYSVEATLPEEKIDSLLAQQDEELNEQKYNFIIAGMAPYGGLAIWLSGGRITTEVAWLQAEPIDVQMKDFLPSSNLTRNEYLERFLEGCKDANGNFQKNGLPDRMLFNRYMQKFNYRISPKFENDSVVFRNIALYYFNGEFNTTYSGEHTSNVMRAKPYKIVLSWSKGNKQYEGYFWTDEKKIIETFSLFYDNDGKKEGDLVIEVGKSDEEFKFFLQDDLTVVEIPVDDWQIMVFKNRLESYRSPNYNKPPGGWRN